jgi:hypothetical protein
MGSVVAEFDVKKDERNRVTLKSVPFDYYHAKVFDDGHIEFYPQVLTDASVSLRALSMMDSAMTNLSRGKVGPAINPRDILGDPADETA